MSTDLQRHVIMVDNGDADEPLSTREMNPLFSSILEARLGRRQILKGSAGAAAIGFMGLGLAGCISGSDGDDDELELAPGDEQPSALLGFDAVPVSFEDKITLPQGYSHQVLIPWGTSLDGDTRFRIESTGTEQAYQVGSHHDGMHFFPIDGSSEDGLLVLNHEYVEPRLMHAAYAGKDLSSGAVLLSSDEKRVDDEVLKEMNAHGVTVVRIVRNLNGEWQVQPDGYNRRITALTEMKLSGPVAGSDLVKTKYSPTGTETRGTLNNCGSGATPWNTYMAAEENWAGYFVNEGTYPREHERYGVPRPGKEGERASGKYEWHLAESGGPDDAYARFNATDSGKTALDDYRNEPNTFGWMVEIDPFDPQSTPVKRTAMGRFGHEGVVFAPVVEGQPVVCYSGDDSRFEYIYKFVSRDAYHQTSASGELLDNGTLYVARFNADGSGEWLPLVYGQNGLDESNEKHAFTSQADVLVNTRLAADLMGATPMDRPEWGAIDPANGDVYFTLTNNSQRGEDDTNEANPRGPNTHGHIIRWAEAGGDHAATSFEWDIFLFAGDSGESGKPTSIGYDPNGEKLTADNILSSPDGMWIDPDSRVWIQMDSGDTDPFGNCAMLVADPTTGELKRFLVGPVGQEITGISMTPDQRTLFINVQHPGGEWPDYDPSVPPRSATVVIWKDDGGIVGT